MRRTAFIVSLLLLAFPTAALAATFTVNTTAPGYDGVCDADCSLLDALLEAEALAGPDEIVLQECATYSLTSIYGAATATPQLYTEITIRGNGATIERDASAPNFRLFLVRPTGILTLERLTLRGGQLPSGGAGIFSQGTLIIRNSILENNTAIPTASWSGGAIHNYFGDVTLEHTTIRNNTAVRGGGIASDGSPTNPANLTINDSAIVGNQAIDAGAYTSLGGGLLIRGQNNVSIRDTTISSNTVDYRGGGILFQSIPVAYSVALRNVTLTDNTAIIGQGGGMYMLVCSYICVVPALPLFENSIIANNTAAANDDWDGDYASGGNNIIGVGAGSFPLTTGDQSVATLPDLSGLLTLSEAGGEHHRPEFGNSGIDAGNSGLCAVDDQLEFSRQGTDCEIGAIEFRECVSPPGQLTNWWAFDETAGGTAQDIGGATANDGSYSGTPTPTPAMVQTGLCFSGTAQSVGVADDAEVDFSGDCSGTTEDLTIDAWVKTAASGLQVIVDKREAAANFLRGYHMYILDGRLGFQLATGTGNSICGSVGSACDDYVSPVPGAGDVDLRDNRWHFVAVSIQRCGTGIGNMYIDGELVHSFAPRVGDIANDVDLLFAERYPVPTTLHYKGCLDELELFHRALTEAELDDIYDAGWAGKCKEPCEEVDYPECGGACPDGSRCQANDVLLRCECTTDPLPCDESGSVCNGGCPLASQECVPDAVGGCFCHSLTPCQQAGGPVCDGFCLGNNEECVSDGAQGCFCFDPSPQPCGESEAPACMGLCDNPDDVCKFIQGSNSCVCTEQIKYCADAETPECLGACDPGEQCVEGLTPMDPCECKQCIVVKPWPWVLVSLPSKKDMEWNPLECAASYNVYSSTISTFADVDRNDLADDYGSCFRSNLPGPSTVDPGTPGIGMLRHYLVTGVNATGEGSLGFNANGAERPNSTPCP